MWHMWRLSCLIVPSSAVPLHIYMYFVLLDRVSACSVLSLERFNYIYVCTRYPDYTSHPLTSVIDPLNLSIPSTFDFEVRYCSKALSSSGLDPEGKTQSYLV
jgi:hypothetical protein